MKENNTAQKTKRLGFFDIAKGMGIILVIIAHIEYVDFGIRNYIVSFHMPLFFVISGMLACLTGEPKRDFRTVLFKKLKRIMLPYLIFSVLYPVIDITYYYVTGNGDPFGSLRQNIYDSIVLYGNSVLWFLPTAFFGDILFLIIMKASMKLSEKYASYITALVTLAVSLSMCFVFRHQNAHLIVAIVRFFPAAFFVSMGNLIFSLMKKIPKRVISATAGILCLVILYFIHGFNGTVDMHFGVYGNPALYLINALVGSMGVILISMAIDPSEERTVLGVVEFYGRNSLFVMITHINFYILYCAEVLSFKIIRFVPRAKDLIFHVMTVLFVLAVEFILIKIYEIGKMKIVSKIAK